MTSSTCITWPAMLRLTGEAELAYLHDQADWDMHAHGSHYLATDVLIDAAGAIYTLERGTDGNIRPQATGKSAALDEVVDAVRGHAAQLGSCCVAKFSASSIPEAIAAVRSFHCES
jgi:predicted NAD/FAD-binding protein